MNTDPAPNGAAVQPGPDAAEPELANDWAALCAAEEQAIAARRRRVLGEAASSNQSELNLPRVGLALSGGGVRSATFALGLMRGLAQSREAAAADPARRTLISDGLLGRLDYLSTVSGGGYAGGMYGRLVATYGVQRALALMARGGSPVLEWLRRNGRYLSPAGSRDVGIAVVTYLRAWVAIHTEFMFACILLGLVVVVPHLWQHSVQVLDPQGWERWHTAWWALSLAFWAALAPGLIAGYWAARDASNPATTALAPGWRDALFVSVAAAGAYLLLRALQPDGAIDPVRHSLNWPSAGVLALVSLVMGQLAVMGWMAASRAPHALKVARLRNWLTRALRVVLLGALALAGLGALDRLSWWVLEEFQTGNQWLWGGVGVGGIALVVLRTLMQPLQKIAAESRSRAHDWLPRLLNFGSLLGLLVLVTAWLVVLQWFIFAPETFSALRSVPAWMRAGLLAAAWLTWVVLTAGNSQMANTSSLHSFYRARLTRAYLAVGNRQRCLDDDAVGNRADVTRVVEGDDTRLRNYRPELEGGPIHLVNTCLNQTRDDKSGLYNADRKGTAVTASWRGFELGPREFIALKPEHDAGTLGRWIAVSGAAASPGAGAYTSRGLSLLVYFLGVRLGHWMRAPRERVQLRWLSRLAWRAIPKPMMLTSEASATFFGVERPWWYLSDGGHFENSGVYALLKRELGFIILSDASCDAQYEFGDIENLVRKARIDFGAEIDFYSREEAANLFTLGSTELTVLSPEDMANNHSCRGVLLARIRYRERPGPGGADGGGGQSFRPEGTLLVIKPNLHDALDVDLLAYAQKHDTFPHESTGDQSFDEAQWESYHRLGEDFGRAMHESWLAQLPGWRSAARHGIRVAARLGSGKDVADAPRAEPLWRRSARATAIGTTLGVGASGTLLLSLWQVQEQLQRNRTDEQTEARQLFTDVSKGLQSFKGSCPEIPEHVVTQASLLLDLRGSPTMRPLEQAGLERLAGRIADECIQEVEASPGCLAAHERIQSSLCALVLKPPTENTALNYWHPGASPREQARDSRKVLLAAAGRFPVFGTRSMPGPQDVTVAAGSPSPAVPVVPPVLVPVRPQASTSSIALPSLQPCLREAGRTTLYIHIYDEASRLPATALRQSLQAGADSPVLVAPVENVIRSADLRRQRRPVPWPKPTLVLHDPASRDCAGAILRHIGAPWVLPGDVDQVWLRDLPRSLQARPGVIELWLPPTEVTTSQNSPDREELVGTLNLTR
ncbi:MAG: hypothetical protein Q7T10_08465 [Rhodoferax sp.]|uniref:hypothetical protein n=1 Tax=Rhodoferax sp. TaxID=50421 RepID=UPI00271F8B02|nr:hypothetical protein [Rhodoferax sp.]MDO8448828.1 hypothetical protein [Rhodoferax sp.]